MKMENGRGPKCCQMLDIKILCLATYFFENGRRPQFCYTQPRELIFGTRWNIGKTSSFFLNGREPQLFENGRRTQFFFTWKTTSFLKIEENLNFFFFKWKTTSIFLWLEDDLQREQETWPIQQPKINCHNSKNQPKSTLIGCDIIVN